MRPFRNRLSSCDAQLSGLPADRTHVGGPRTCLRRARDGRAGQAVRAALPAALAVVGVLALVPFVAVGALAAWVATDSNGGSQFSTAASFPNYPTSVTNDGAWAYHREEETPSSAGTSTAADSSGNSRPGTYGGTTNGPSTWWAMNDGSGTTAADSSGAANPGTLVNSPSWVNGANGGGLAFNGTSSYVAGRGPAVHSNASLSVAAWVNLNSTGSGSDEAAVSQNGTHSFGFLLGMDGTSKKWVFKMANSDVTSPTVVSEYSSNLASTAVWVHLVGVYDTSVQKIYLYVNGSVIGNAGKTLSWDATGAVQAGRDLAADSWGQFFNGSVDDVRIYNRALSATEIANLAQSKQSVKWNFSESSGTTTADTGTEGNTGTLGSGTSFAAGHAGNGVQMSGTSTGYVVGAANAVRTDQSFTVAAWVNLNSFGTGAARTAVAEPGSSSSGFVLKYDSSGVWAFTMPEGDQVTPAVDQITSFSSSTNTWVHLAGVFDATAHTMQLYVNASSQGTTTHSALSTWNATGALQAGRSFWDGAYADAWYGTLDSVRVYQRALSSSDVTNLYNETDPASPFTEAAMTAGVPGALQGTYQGLSSSTAVAFAGGTTAYNNTTQANPTTFTLECWLRVSGTPGGEVLGFHSTTSGSGGTHDRALYVDSGGRLTFAVTTAQSIRSAATVTNAGWHHVVASLGAAGMRLYIDGTLVASAAQQTPANYTGYWHWGGGDLTGMPNRPTDDYLTGSVDEVAFYTTQLSDTAVALHYQRNY